MVTLTQTAKQTSAKLRQLLSKDPLLRPLGRTPDSVIKKALAVHRLRRADLFSPGTTLAPHRYRIAKMLAAYHFSPQHIIQRHWRELKLADHRCAHCSDKRRCDRWLRGRHKDDAPRRFCPNVESFERWRRDYLRPDRVDGPADGDAILERGLARTRQLLKQLRLNRSSPSGR